MTKKYRYNVGLSAEEESTGTVDLTKEQAKVVAYATNSDNWDNTEFGTYTGAFWIDIENPMEIEQ